MYRIEVNEDYKYELDTHIVVKGVSVLLELIFGLACFVTHCCHINIITGFVVEVPCIITLFSFCFARCFLCKLCMGSPIY